MISTKIKDLIKKDYVKSFIICFFIAFFSLLPFVIKGKGFFVLTNDFNDQQIPFTIGLHNALLDGGFGGFSWDVDLGTSTLDGFGFYEMGSPFFWVTMLFPANAFPYIVAWLFMLKFALAGTISCFYFRRFLSDERLVVLGSILYAFSGFSLCNMLFYHFHEAIIFFPLMLIGLERLKEKKDYLFFIFSIALNCFINYFFFMGEVIFLIIYYLFRFVSRDIKGLIQNVIKCIGCGILGVGMASVMFIPSIVFAMGNPRTGQVGGFTRLIKLTSAEYLYIIKNLLLPAETMTSVSVINEQNFSSHGMYLPVFGLVLVLAYLIRKRDWLFRIILYCTVASFFPLLSDLFYMYSAAQMRWWYMFNLMVVLASMKTLEDVSPRAIKVSAAIYLSFIAIFVVVLNVLNATNAGNRTWINDAPRFYVWVAIAVVGTIITLFMVTKPEINYKWLTSIVAVFALCLTFATALIYKTCDWMGYQAYKQRYDIATELQLPNNQYRLNDTMNLVSMTAHVAGFTNQTSTNTNSIFDFEAIFDYYHNVAGMPKNNIPGLAELLAGKYGISFEGEDASVVQKFETDLGTVYLKEHEACPIGFAIDSYITLDELMSLPLEERAIALLDSAVLNEEDVTDQIKADLPCKKAEDIDLDKTVSEYVTEHTYGQVVAFNKDGHGMTCATDYDEDTYVYFSVPYDTGWTATVDGNQTDIIVSGGMMIIKVPAGNHAIQFSYFTPGLKTGIIVSIISWFVFIILVTFKKKSGNKNEVRV